jgi:hypothetical protein
VAVGKASRIFGAALWVILVIIEWSPVCVRLFTASLIIAMVFHSELLRGNWVILAVILGGLLNFYSYSYDSVQVFYNLEDRGGATCTYGYPLHCIRTEGWHYWGDGGYSRVSVDRLALGVNSLFYLVSSFIIVRTASFTNRLLTPIQSFLKETVFTPAPDTFPCPPNQSKKQLNRPSCRGHRK